MPQKFELWFYPEGQPYNARQKHGQYDTVEAAMAAAAYPDKEEWQRSGSGWILADAVLDNAGRETSWFDIERRWAQREEREEPKPSGQLITIRLVQHGETEMQVDAGLYADAKANGRLDHLLDTRISDMDTDTTVVEPDGTRVNPHA